MKLFTKTRVRRALIPLAALAVAAAIVPTAGAAECGMTPGANCQNQDMRHLGNTMKGADMTGADMRGADMRKMNLTNINLTNADLRGAKLDGAKMNGANLTGAMMNGVKMKNVKMSGVKLVGTKLQKATLTGVTIDSSIIRDVDARGARFIGGGMTNSMIVGMKTGRARTTRTANFAWCGGTPGSGTRYQARYLGWAWQSNYSFAGSTLTGDYSCSSFVGINWDGATMLNANFQTTAFGDAQDHSEQIVAINTDFSGANFNSAFWAPGIALGVTLDYASCPAINGNQANGVWGRYNNTSPYWVGSTQSGHWAYGVVSSTFFGDIVFQSQPVVVSVSKERQATISNAYKTVSRPYFPGTPFCPVLN